MAEAVVDIVPDADTVRSNTMRGLSVMGSASVAVATALPTGVSRHVAEPTKEAITPAPPTSPES